MNEKLKTSKGLNITLWIAQGLLAVTFIWAGFMKLTKPEQLPFPWIKDSPNLVILAGIFDLLGGIGIVMPMLLKIKPKLTVYAAYGIMLLMIAASAFHVSRGEAKDIGFNIFMLLLAGFVSWGRKPY